VSGRWILIQASEDGSPVTYLSDSDVAELLADPSAEHGIRAFHAEVPEEQDAAYWPEGTALLLRAEIVVPRRATTAWELP